MSSSRPPSAPPPRVGEGTARARVLVIDDDVGVARALQRTLRDHDVVTVSSGRAALDLLATGVEFDVVFCDLMMPDVAGPDVHASLLKTRPDLCPRMVFVSGGAFTPQTEQFARTTTCRLVSKPFDTKTIRGIVSERLAARGPAR